jgi:hypothetical protein
MAVNINHAAGTDSTHRIVYSRPKTLFFRISWKAEGKLVSLSLSRAPVGDDRYYYLYSTACGICLCISVLRRAV